MECVKIRKMTLFETGEFSLNEQLQQACLDHSSTAIQRCLEHGADPNILIDNDHTVLHMMCDWCDPTLVRLCIDKGANVNAFTVKYQYSPLLMIRKRGEDAMQILYMLVEAGADVNHKNIIGTGLIQNALMYEQSLEFIERLVELGANVNGGVFVVPQDGKATVIVETNYPLIPLVSACNKNRADVVKLLLDHKAYPNAMESYRASPLHQACKQDHLEMVKMLLLHGANANILYDTKPPIYDVRNDSVDMLQLLWEHGADVNYLYANESLLTRACNTGNTRPITFLSDHGANVNIQTSNSKNTPLLAAILGHQNKEVIVTLLLKRGADARLQDASGVSPLMAALLLPSLMAERLTQILLPLSDVNAQSVRGSTALYNAIRESEVSFQVVSQLIEAGANIHVRPHDESYLYHACVKQREKLVKHLLEKNVNVNERNGEREYTALHYLCREGFNPKIVDMLVKHGADIDALDGLGCTPLRHLCFKSGHMEDILWMVDHGANINHVDHVDNTPIHYICQRGFDYSLEEIQTFVKHGADVHVIGHRGKSVLHHLVDTNMFAALLEKMVAREAYFLGLGVNPNIQDITGQTALHIVTQRGTFGLEEVKVFHRFGANLALRGRGQYTCMHRICSEFPPNTIDVRIQTIQFLLQHGAPVNDFTNEEDTPLTLLCQQNNPPLSMVQCLVEAGVDIHHENNRGFHALYYIAHARHQPESLAVFSYLLERGAHTMLMHGREEPYYFEPAFQVMYRDLFYYSLRDAIRLDDVERMNLVLSSMEKDSIREYVNVVDDEGYSNLHRAVEKENVDVMTRLVNLGANVLQSNGAYVPILHTAFSRKFFGIFTSLFNFVHSKGQGMDVRNSVGDTFWHLLATLPEEKFDDLETRFHFLLMYQPHLVNEKDDWGRTTLHISASRGKTWLMSRMLESAKLGRLPVDKWARDKGGATACHIVSRGTTAEHLEWIGTFFYHFYDPMEEDPQWHVNPFEETIFDVLYNNEGYTPLYEAFKMQIQLSRTISLILEEEEKKKAKSNEGGEEVEMDTPELTQERMLEKHIGVFSEYNDMILVFLFMNTKAHRLQHTTTRDYAFAEYVERTPRLRELVKRYGHLFDPQRLEEKVYDLARWEAREREWQEREREWEEEERRGV